MSNDESWSEEYRKRGEIWVELKAAADLLKEAKTAALEQRKAALGDMAVNKAEMLVKASSSWYDYISNMIEAERKANLAKISLDYAKMQFQTYINKDANTRAEMKLL